MKKTISAISRITTQPTEQATFELSDDADDTAVLLDEFELLRRDELLPLLLPWLELPLL